MSGDVAVRSEGSSSGMPSGTVSTANALMLPDGLSFGEWARIGDLFASTESRIAWTIGDWRVYGDRFADEYGEGLEQIDRASETVRLYALVSRAFPPVARATSLTWRHHFEIAARVKDTDLRLRWLSEAERHGWSTRELGDRIGERRITGPRPPALSLRATGDVVERFALRAQALGMVPRDLALEVLEMASQLDDPVAALESAGARRPAGKEA